MDIYELETASGVVVSVGGQLAQNIALRLQEDGHAKVLGTDPKDIDKAEDRQKFSEILDSIGVDQPAWKELTSVADAEKFADEDKANREKVEARNALENYTFSLKNQINDKDGMGGKLNEEDKETLLDAVREAAEWLEENAQTATVSTILGFFHPSSSSFR